MKVSIYNHSDNAMPEYATVASSGMDLRANLTESITINAGDCVLIPTGIHLGLPVGYEAQIRPRSGMCLKHCIEAKIGTIDADYRGEIGIITHNFGKEPFTIHHGDRIAQMVFAKVEQVELVAVESKDALGTTERAEGGFGHTGIN